MEDNGAAQCAEGQAFGTKAPSFGHNASLNLNRKQNFWSKVTESACRPQSATKPDCAWWPPSWINISLCLQRQNNSRNTSGRIEPLIQILLKKWLKKKKENWMNEWKCYVFQLGIFCNKKFIIILLKKNAVLGLSTLIIWVGVKNYTFWNWFLYF